MSIPPPPVKSWVHTLLEFGKPLSQYPTRDPQGARSTLGSVFLYRPQPEYLTASVLRKMCWNDRLLKRCVNRRVNHEAQRTEDGVDEREATLVYVNISIAWRYVQSHQFTMAHVHLLINEAF